MTFPNIALPCYFCKRFARTSYGIKHQLGMMVLSVIHTIKPQGCSLGTLRFLLRLLLIIWLVTSELYTYPMNFYIVSVIRIGCDNIKTHRFCIFHKPFDCRVLMFTKFSGWLGIHAQTSCQRHKKNNYLLHTLFIFYSSSSSLIANSMFSFILLPRSSISRFKSS